MRNFIRNYNINRKRIWFILGVIFGSLILVYVLNNRIKNEKLDFSSNNTQIISQQFYDTNYSVISSQKIDTQTSSEVTNIIKNFINLCNKGNIEGAYNMLSPECKEVLYPTLETFKTRYYNNKFSEKMTFSLQSWITEDNKYIYRVELTEDMLSTGKTSNLKIQDYYTVIKKQEKYYLNISGFIEKNIIDSEASTDFLNCMVESEEVFFDYLNLNIKIENKTRNKILLDEGKKSNTVFITDSEQMNYISYLYEENNMDLIILPRSVEIFKIKYMKSYKENRYINTVNFENIILNYETSNPQVSNIKVEL